MHVRRWDAQDETCTCERVDVVREHMQCLANACYCACVCVCVCVSGSLLCVRFHSGPSASGVLMLRVVQILSDCIKGAFANTKPLYQSEA